VIYFQNIHSAFPIDNISQRRKDKVKQFTFAADKLRSLAAGYLIAEKLGADEADFSYTKQGKPYLPGNRVYFSVSHSGDWAVLAVSDAPVAVDIERTDRLNLNKERIAARFFTESERRWLAENFGNPNAFYYVWTAREAAYKLGEQLTIGDTRLRFSEPYDGYVMCVCE
jgi:4'-phosphopantetheinyl transferase